MFCVVHVYYDNLSKVILGQAVFYSIHLGADVVVHVYDVEHRLITIDLDDDVADDADYPDHRLVTIDLEEDVVVHVDYLRYRL